MAKAPANGQGSAAPAHGRAGALDWGNLRFFLELARTGSLGRAARGLGVDRNTVARRVGALEAELGLALFERGPQGWTRTPAGDDLAALAGRVEEDVLAIARHADASDRAVAGTVRLTAATHIAAHLLAPEVPALRARHPALVLEVAADQRTFDLTKREADLALRLGRPRSPGLVTRKLSDVAYRLYAAPAYLSAEGGAARPRAVDFARDAFVGFEESLASTPHERWLDGLGPERTVVFRCNSTAALASAARAGAGVAVLPCFVAERAGDLVPLSAPEPVPPHELWLLVHGDLRRTPRVKAVIEWVDALVARARPALCGEAAPGPGRAPSYGR
jgi:DNA-binding transcriptional LysR family regulator